MLEFTFDNTVKKLTISEDCELSFSLVGGGGAPGGYDSHAPSQGINGDIVSGVVSLKKGDIVYCAVGERGYTGSGGWGVQPGGAGGSSINGFSGGRGGNSGPSGASGAGGGAGGATVLWKNGSAPAITASTTTVSRITYPCTFNTSTFSSNYLFSPLAKSNGVFVRSMASLENFMGPVDFSQQRQWWVIKNGLIVAQGTTGNKIPSQYNPSKFIGSKYYYWDEWPGGGDYITMYDLEEVISTINYTSNIIAIAAGGGGGGGGGNHSNGYISSRTPYAYSLKSDNTYDTRGAAGQYHQGDGGGGGGGGGGYYGGSGGVCGNGDNGGQAGSNGLSFVSPDVKSSSIATGNPGLYGGNWSYSTYDSNTNGYAALDSLQTNSYIFTKLKNVTKYTNSTTPSYYPRVPYCNAWGSLLNDMGVWSGTITDSPNNGTPSGAWSCDLSWRVYFPVTGDYTFELQADNYAQLYVDDTAIIETQGEGSAYRGVWTATTRITQGWRTVRTTANNWGGPYGVAGRITYLKQVLTGVTLNSLVYGSETKVLWTTLSEISPLTQAKYYTSYDGWSYGSYSGALLNPSNKLAINDGTSATYTWNVYFPISGNYTFSMTIDDIGSVKLDSRTVIDLPTSKESNWNTINTNTIYVEAGYHVVTINYTNLGGPGGVAGYILDNTGKRIWTTRDNYNINAYEVEEVIGAGEWKPIREIKYRQNGQWISIPELRVRVNGSWVKTYGNVVNSYVSLSSLMNNTSGPMYPAFPPPPADDFWNYW